MLFLSAGSLNLSRLPPIRHRIHTSTAQDLVQLPTNPPRSLHPRLQPHLPSRTSFPSILGFDPTLLRPRSFLLRLLWGAGREEGVVCGELAPSRRGSIHLMCFPIPVCPILARCSTRGAGIEASHRRFLSLSLSHIPSPIVALTKVRRCTKPTSYPELPPLPSLLGLASTTPSHPHHLTPKLFKPSQSHPLGSPSRLFHGAPPPPSTSPSPRWRRW